MSSQVCRWGILGTANIARKNWKAMRLAGNSTLTAVASRDAGRAQSFIENCQTEIGFVVPPGACSYDELLHQDDVDAVYIPLPTGIRKDWVIRAAEAGKHVLCEKPCAPTAEDLFAMLEACRAKGVQFMDGVMFMHSARLPLLRATLDDGKTVGELRRIATQFSFAAPDEFFNGNIRAKRDMEPLGCLGDLGWYNIRFCLWVMGYQMPEKVSGRLLATHNDVPTEFSGELHFPGGVSASFYCSFRTELQQWCHVSGTRGSVHVSDFVLPYYGCESAFASSNPTFHVEGCSFRMEDHTRRWAAHEYSDGAANSQETNMIRTFADLVLSGKVDNGWGDIALLTQEVLDACLQSARNGGKLVPITE